MMAVISVVICLWNSSKNVEMDILTLSSSESQTVSTRNKSRTRYGSADAKKSRMINKQVSSSITA